MNYSVRNQYLNAEVMTATPQKLHLMVIEAAIRSCEKARAHWGHEDRGHTCEALIHAQACVGQLLAGLNADAGAELVGKIASVYLFIFRRLTEANNKADEAALNDAIRVLHTERETWRQVCEKFSVSDAAKDVLDVTDEPSRAIPSPLVDLPDSEFGALSAGPFSLEA